MKEKLITPSFCLVQLVSFLAGSRGIDADGKESSCHLRLLTPKICQAYQSSSLASKQFLSLTMLQICGAIAGLCVKFCGFCTQGDRIYQCLYLFSVVITSTSLFF
jgi:hypothetical protein